MKRSVRRSMRRRATVLTPNLVPLIDTVLVLLVIFMVTVPALRHAVRVDLAYGDLQEAVESSDDVVVILGGQGALYINDFLVKKESFGALLEKKLAVSKSKTVFVDVDRTVPAGEFIELIDTIKGKQGVERVVLDTQAHTARPRP